MTTAVRPRRQPVPSSGSLRATFLSKMGPVAWMLYNEPDHLNQLYAISLSLMRLEGMHAWADAVENGELIECATCRKAAIVAGFSADGEPLCGRCVAAEQVAML